MDERELRAFHRAVHPILQRTAPTGPRAPVRVTPSALEQIAWGVVLAYVANVSRQPPAAIPRQALSGESSLGDDQVRAALLGLREPAVHPRLAPEPQSLARFTAAAGRMLEASGWTAERAGQAAAEAARALEAATR